MKTTVTVSRDENHLPLEVKIKRGRKKLKVTQVFSPSGDVYSFEIEGRRGVIPSFSELLAIVNARRLDRIGTIDEVTLLKLLEEISLIKRIDSVGEIAYSITPHGTEGIALKQVAGTGAAWVHPTSHTTPQGGWTNPENAWDDDTATLASNFNDYTHAWERFIYLIRASVKANRLRFFASNSFTGVEGRKIDIDVYKDGSWVHVAELTDYDEDTWVEVGFTEGNVRFVRVRFYNNREVATTHYLYEVEIYQVATGGGELIVQPEQSDETKLKATTIYSPPSTFVSGHKTISAGGNSEPISADTALKNSCLLQAKHDNTAVVIIGNASNQHVRLNPNDTVVVVAENLNLVYMFSSVTGEGVNYIGS